MKFERSLNTKAGDAGTALVRALSAIDRAASKGVIHPNAAARKKSRLSRRFNRLNAQGA
ncbi:MAG: 30S ribosomal protein S20 [Firmicutes bacterium]|nr:30S ribosomal protein S20 [Bacillota bacterium]